MFDSTIGLLERSLDLRMKAHEAHVSNVANANVPNYKALRADFEGKMKEALDRADSSSERTRIAREHVIEEAVRNVAPDIHEDPLLPMNGMGNTVDMEREQTEIAKNTIGYQTAIQLINKKFAMQKYVVSEGAR
jgi:flagellar basal-body rod protein FlgB